MGWDGAGGYVRQHNFSADASSGINILAARMDAELNDFASAMTLAWTRNGQNVPTTDLPMGGRRFINVGAPTSVSNFMRAREFIENVPIFMQDAESSADRISVSSQYFTSVSANQAPADGTKIMVRVNSDKSSAVLYLDGHSANVEFQDGTRAAEVMVSGGIYELTYSSADVAWRLPSTDRGRTAAERTSGVTPTNFRFAPGDVRRYGAVAGGTAATNDAAIQAASTLLRDHGIAMIFGPGETYPVSANNLGCYRTSALQSDRWVVHGNGAQLDFSASGLTSGNLTRWGADAQARFSENGFIKFASPLYVLGPETGNPRTDPSPDGTTIGWSLEYCANPDISGCWARRCYEGIRTNFVFHLKALGFYARQCYIGAYITDDSTLSGWYSCAFTEAIYGVVLQLITNTKTISSQLFVQPWIQDVAVPFSVDPLDGTGVGIDTLSIINPYYETITYDYHRFGLAWTFADPGTPGADRDREIINTYIPPGGQWGGPTWASGLRAYRTTTASTVKGGDIWMPAAMANAVGDFTGITLRAGRDKTVGDGSVIQTSLHGALALGGGSMVSRTLSGSKTWDPGSLADGAVESTTVTVTGAALGDCCIPSFSEAIPGGMQMSADVTNTDTVTVKLHNVNAGTTNLASGTLKVLAFR